MAPAQSKRQSRKRRRSSGGGRPSAPPEAQTRARAEVRARAGSGRRPGGAVDELSAILTGRTYGERPSNPFGGVPVSEIAILAGGVAIVVGASSGGRVALITGIVVCALGVLEVTVREHFSGYRSHASLLAAAPAVALVALSAAVLGAPHQRGARELMLAAALPVFGALFWLLRRRFQAARQARVVSRAGGGIGGPVS